jgi:peptidoglycan/xylan/chitin deacetylase (PgdA/CDA1 family)
MSKFTGDVRNMRKKLALFFISTAIIMGCSNTETMTDENIGEDINSTEEIKEVEVNKEENIQDEEKSEVETVIQELEEVMMEVKGQIYGDSSQFSEYVDGVKTKMITDEKVIALTLDACGGEFGSGYDVELMEFLIENNIKADLFVNARWIDAQFETFMELAENPLFTIQNHGTEHKPLSTIQRSAWGISSTATQDEIIEEIMQNQLKIFNLTGVTPQYFRSGTAYYDEVSILIAESLGVEVVNFDVIGDGGATFTKDQIADSMKTAEKGSIIILHMNQPDSETAEGVKEGVRYLLQEGFRFVHLKEYELY